MSRKNCARLLCSAAVIALASGTVAWADEASFNIAPQSLDTALNAFSEQSAHPVLFKSDMALAKRSPGVTGSSDPEIALNQLLQGTGLTWKRAGDTFVIVGASDPQSGSAAGDGAEGTVQALIVTAQKREENIQDVPIAMSAFSQEDLTKSQVTGGPDLMTQIPNFTFTKTNFTGYSIQIRGIGTQAISATTDAAVAVAMNNTPFIRNRFFEQEFYDLQRVEVLRGPQGTLYGRNATAGVVNIITAKPSFQYEAKLSGDVGNYNSTRLEGMVNLPIVADRVALRLAGAWTKRDGYDTNQMTGQRIDGRDLWSTRLSLRVDPTANISANLIWEHFQEDDDRLRSGKQLCHKDLRDNINGVPISQQVLNYGDPAAIYTQGCAPASLYSPGSFQTPNGFSLPYYEPLVQLGVPGFLNFDPYLSASQSRDLRVIESSFEPRYRARSDLGELQIALDLTNDLTLTSETAYSRDTIWSIEDFNRFTTAPGAFQQEVGPPDGNDRPGVLVNGFFCDPQLGCSDRVLAADLSTAKSTQFSQEFRLSSDFGGPFNFSLGGNFLRYDTTEKYYVFVNTLTLLSATILTGAAGRRVTTPPWDPYSTDNHRCMIHGLIEGDPNGLYGVGRCTNIEPAPISALQDVGHNYFLSDNPYKLISYAVFGEAYYKLTDNLKLTAGLRWTVDKKEAPRIPSELLASFSIGYPVAEVVEQEWREPTGRLAIDWKPDLSFTDETLVYGSYSHGYKAGGANPPKPVTVTYCLGCEGSQQLYDAIRAQSLTTPRTFAPEFVNAFEIGSKNTLLDGHLTLNGDAFYYDYTGYQISEIVDRSAFNHNYDAKIWGVEFEADWRPLENLRLGAKLGYEDTRVAKGMYAIDLMDRTAGDPNWVVVKPFPTVPSNCIIPVWLATFGGFARTAPFSSSGFCQEAYQLHHDPVTANDYVANPQPSDYADPFEATNWPGYPGFDPSTAPNNGEGIAKSLSGNSLPNAPHYTVTVTADYTVPLPGDWLMTLHTDFYHQSEAWTRIFNDPGYDKLKAYNNVNFAAIFANEGRGWTVMAYVKNVLDKDNITSAFLNSDDTGLTTNVFLNEPRLYGLRVTKNWTGGTAGSGGAANVYRPIQVELGGQVVRQDAPYATLGADFFNQFPDNLNTSGVQHRDQDWGQGGSVRLTYAPQPEGWWVSGGVRWGRTNASDLVRKKHVSEVGYCQVGPPFQWGCVPHKYFQAGMDWVVYPISYGNAAVRTAEQHQFVDFQTGKDVGLGGLSRSKFGAGIGYADLKSTLRMSASGVPSWDMPADFVAFKYSQHHRYEGHWDAEREFKGAGPILSWDAATQLMPLGDGGAVNLDWGVSGGVLFGKQKARIDGQTTDEYFNVVYYRMAYYVPPTSSTTTSVHMNRNKSVAVPMLDLSLGLSYEIDRFKVSTGYRWERYVNAIDGGYQEHKSFDRTYDGPYFKVSVGFGG